MNKGIILSAVLAGAAAAAPVFAAPITYNWTGPYAGLNLGDASVSSNPKTTVPYTTEGYFAQSSTASIDANGSPHLNANGFIGGAQIGYNKQSGHIVYGLQLDADSMDTSASKTGTTVYPDFAPTTYTLHQDVKTSSIFMARPRIGWTNGTTLIYVTGGVAVAQFKFDERFTDTFDDVLETDSKSASETGSVFGLGAEFAVQKNVTVDAEYLYASFGKISSSADFSSEEIDEGQSTFYTSANLNANIFRLGVNVKF